MLDLKSIMLYVNNAILILSFQSLHVYFSCRTAVEKNHSTVLDKSGDSAHLTRSQRENF